MVRDLAVVLGGADSRKFRRLSHQCQQRALHKF